MVKFYLITNIFQFSTSNIFQFKNLVNKKVKNNLKCRKLIKLRENSTFETNKNSEKCKKMSKVIHKFYMLSYIHSIKITNRK